MQCGIIPVFLLGLLPVMSMAVADQDLAAIMRKGNLHEAIRIRSESVLLDELTALEQAEAQAKSRSAYGLELRPRVTNSEVGLALRIYLPDRWSKDKLREQLALVAESEQLRVAALDWQEVMAVYRDFCAYRMLRRKQTLFDEEILNLEPYLGKADQSVELRQLAVPDRAKLYSHYLDLVNDREQVKSLLLEMRQQLRLVLGHAADLERFSAIAVVEMPPQMEFEPLLRQALGHRADYRQSEVDTRSLGAAEAVARSEDGFRFKYIQPGYDVDYEGGENSWWLSAAFVLPWGTRNPDIAVYQRQYALSVATMDLQRAMIEERLRVLLKTAEEYYNQADQRRRTLKPLLKQLSKDLEQMDTGRLEQLRDLLLIRDRILDVALQTSEAIRQKERIAVDLAEEIGSLEP